MRGLAGQGAERAEIVLAEQGLGGDVHALRIQRQALPGDVARVQRCTHRPVEDVVAVTPAARCVTRVETVRHRLRPQHRHAGRQVGTGTQYPATHVATRLGIEVHDLATPMHAGVGAPRAADLDRMVGDFRQGLLQHSLHADVRLQALPAVEIGAVVFDAESNAHGVVQEFAERRKISRPQRHRAGRSRPDSSRKLSRRLSAGCRAGAWRRPSASGCLP